MSKGLFEQSLDLATDKAKLLAVLELVKENGTRNIALNELVERVLREMKEKGEE